MSRIRSSRNGENLLIEEVESQHLLISSEYNFVRDEPLEKLWGGRGIFELQEFFFVIKFLV